MLHLKKVIPKISEKESKEFIFWLEQNHAEKLVRLFSLLNENKLEESAIANELKTTPSGYYTLKSRLNSKMQEFFSYNVPESNVDLLRNVANIPNLLFNSPQELAVTHLLKMEKDLIKYDIPFALTTVYSALKTLTRYSQKYPDYAKLYNKHIAYTMTIDKASELLADFNKILGEYLMSRDEKLLETLGVIRGQMHKYARLYESQRLIVYQNILDVEFTLFVITYKNHEPVISIEEILIETSKIIKLYEGDASYSFMSTLINFLWFQYYYELEQDKKIPEYFDYVNTRLPSFLRTNFCCFPSLFLLLKVKWYLNLHMEEKLYEESKLLSASFTPNTEDVPNYINHIKYNAIAAYYSGKYTESVILLNGLVNKINFRNLPYAEIEVKLFLASCYLMANKPELANTLIKNIQRKIRNVNFNAYENARVFAKMLSLALNHHLAKEKWGKLLQLRNKFQELNKQPVKMLDFLHLDNTFFESISIKSQMPKLSSRIHPK